MSVEQFYIVYKDGEKVGSHLTKQEAETLRHQIDNADHSWWDRPYIRIISEQENEERENTLNIIKGKDFIRFNYKNGYISKIKIKKAYRDAYDVIHIRGAKPREQTSYTYDTFRKLLSGNYDYDGNSIISLGIGGIKKYIAKQKDAYDKLNASVVQYELDEYNSKFRLEENRVVVKKKQNPYDKRRRG